jgi:hypothetical protein
MTSSMNTIAGLLVVLASATVACGGDGGYEAACDAGCDCVGCSEAGRQDCYDNGKAAYDHAVEKGCEAESEESAACTAEHTVCEGGVPVLDEVDACDEAHVALSSCLGN